MKNIMRLIIVALTLSVLLVLPLAAGAYVFDGKDVNVEYWTGTGANQALCLVDFGANSYAFGYQWDGAASGYDMIKSISDNGPVDVTFTYGTFVDGVAYNGDNQSGYNGGENWWHYWVSSDGVAWDSPWDYGAADRVLTNGAWDGWVYGNALAPRMPGAVPEPSSIMALFSLIGLSGSAKLLRSRRK